LNARRKVVSNLSRIILGLSAALLTLGAARDCRTGTIDDVKIEVPVTAEVDMVTRIGTLEKHVQTIDSWTSLILAGTVGLSFVGGVGAVIVYVLGHRFGWFRMAVDLCKGKHTAR
jgi:integral membrane sensor domain MASE1